MKRMERMMAALASSIRDDASSKVVASLIDVADRVTHDPRRGQFIIQLGAKKFTLSEIHKKVRSDLGFEEGIHQVVTKILEESDSES